MSPVTGSDLERVLQKDEDMDKRVALHKIKICLKMYFPEKQHILILFWQSNIQTKQVFSG